MKTRTKSNVDRFSPKSVEEEPVIIASKRKASSPSAANPPTAKGLGINMPKRLRTSPPAASPAHSFSFSPPSTSTSLTPTPTTPQTPSKPAVIGNGKLSARKQRIIRDPINITIYDLRKQALDWNDIADKTNSTCNLVGTDAELTGPACYSRFFRNGTLVAREKGEEWKREWYLHMKGPIQGAGGAEEEEDGEDLEKGEPDVVEVEVAKAVEKVRGEFWENVMAMVNENLPDQVLTVEEVKAVHDRVRDRET